MFTNVSLQTLSMESEHQIIVGSLQGNEARGGGGRVNRNYARGRKKGSI